MLTSWPMVIGALIAGVLMGLLVPSPKPASTPVAPPLVSSEKSDAKAKRELSATKEKDSVATKESAQAPAPAQPAAESKSAKQDSNPCSQQAWPYYSPSCIDRTAPAPATFQVTNTRPADPAIALREEKKQASAPDPARQTPKAIPPTPTQATAPPLASPPQAQTPARPSTAPNSRAPNNAQASSADVERQVEQPRQRQQPRVQPRYTRIEPPDDDDYDSPRVLLRRDGTRVYVPPEGRAPPGHWRSW
jgi:hypothetical protein